jgi:hypothetical protein
VKSPAIHPQNLPERLIWYAIIGTYGLYYLGAQYIVAPLLGLFLMIYWVRQWWIQPADTPEIAKMTLSWSTWIWIVAMLLIEVALIAGHLNYGLGIGKVIGSTVNRWLRSWALFACFAIAGHLSIRPQLIYRAICILCVQGLILSGVALLANIAHAPILSYTSPLKIFGGGDYYDVKLFGLGLDEQQTRLQLFAPWPPALGFVANLHFFLARQERHRVWRWLGMMGAVVLIVGSISRLGILCLPTVLALTWVLLRIISPWVQIALGASSCLLGVLAPTLWQALSTVKEQFTNARPGSSRVRSALGRIAVDRWWREAPIWGHGSVEPRGPAAVAFKPIGTHHAWFGLLFTHGLVGCLALAIALLSSGIDMLIKAYHHHETAQVGLCVVLVIFLFSFGENIGGLIYLYWPALVIVGIASHEPATLRRPKLQSAAI